MRVRLDPAEGSEQSGDRRGLVVSPDLINEHSPMVLVAAITSKKTERVFPFEALIAGGEGGLPQLSKVLPKGNESQMGDDCQGALPTLNDHWLNGTSGFATRSAGKRLKSRSTLHRVSTPF